MKLNTFLAIIAVIATNALCAMQQRQPLPGWRINPPRGQVIVTHPQIPSQRTRALTVQSGYYNPQTGEIAYLENAATQADE